ncbi:MAG TPA: hypothetical protein VMT04_02395, partial [Terriglobales bacterium]|nr:hypothetical protein [Terriglobales bacterium]
YSLEFVSLAFGDRQNHTTPKQSDFLQRANSNLTLNNLEPHLNLFTKRTNHQPQTNSIYGLTLYKK